jgi:hypothetical protein
MSLWGEWFLFASAAIIVGTAFRRWLQRRRIRRENRENLRAIKRFL